MAPAGQGGPGGPGKQRRDQVAVDVYGTALYGAVAHRGKLHSQSLDRC